MKGGLGPRGADYASLRTAAAARSRFGTLVAAGCAVLVLAAAGAAVHAPIASACSEPAANHCHGIAILQDSAGLGGNFGEVRTNCVNLAASDEFVSNEIWAATSNGARWMETGLVKGAQFGTTSLKFFWARNDPNLSPAFKWVDLGAAPANTYEVVELTLSGGQWWSWTNNIWNNTTAITTPVANDEAGTETNSNNTSSWGSALSLEWAPGGNPSSWGAWSGAFTHQDFNTRVGFVQPDWIQSGAGNITC